MKNVIGISLGAKSQDFDFRTRFLGVDAARAPPRHRRQPAQAAKLLRHWDTQADAIGLGLVKDSGGVAAAAAGATPGREAGARWPRHVPVSHGARLADLFLEWAVRHAQSTLGHYFDNARVLFFSGLANQKLAMSMAEYTANLQFADPLLQLGVPKLLTSIDALGLYASGAHYVADWAPPRLLPGPLLQAVVAPRAAQGDGHGHGGGGAGARARRLRPRGAGRQDHRHQHRQRRAAGAVPATRACTWWWTARRWCRATRSTRRCWTR